MVTVPNSDPPGNRIWENALAQLCSEEGFADRCQIRAEVAHGDKAATSKGPSGSGSHVRGAGHCDSS